MPRIAKQSEHETAGIKQPDTTAGHHERLLMSSLAEPDLPFVTPHAVEHRGKARFDHSAEQGAVDARHGLSRMAPRVAWATKWLCVAAASSAVGGPFPDTSPRANENAPSSSSR